MPKFDQKGVAQIFIVLILLLGIAVTVWLVQYGRTVLKPKAYETGTVACAGTSAICNTTIGRATLVRETKDRYGSCQRVEQDLGTCSEFFCPDNLCYFDNNANRWIHKTGGTWENEDCVYAFDVYDSLDACNKALDESVAQKRSKDKSQLAPKRCEPGTWNAQRCTVCNSNGSGYLQNGSDWGNATENPSGWCACAKEYSEKITGKPYSVINYPGCPVSGGAEE